MPARALRTVTIALVAFCYSGGVFAGDSGRPRHAKSWKHDSAHTLAPDRDPYADPSAPYKAVRLSSPQPAQPIANIPGQTTVLTRQILDDMNATTLQDALRATAGVTVGR
jgi:outer membrane receptor for monomeric catechols